MTYPTDPSSGAPYGQQPSSGAPHNQPPPAYGQQPSSGAPYDQPPPAYGQQPPPAYGQQPPPAYGQQPDPYTAAQYGQQPQYYAQPSRGMNVMAILSLIFAFVFAPVGIVLGHIAKRQIARTGEEGSGLATAGLIVSYIITGIYVLVCAGVIIAAIASSATSTSSY
jgi:hypothetical protein